MSRGLIRGEGAYCKQLAMTWGLIRGGLNQGEDTKSRIYGTKNLTISFFKMTDLEIKMKLLHM